MERPGTAPSFTHDRIALSNLAVARATVRCCFAERLVGVEQTSLNLERRNHLLVFFGICTNLSNLKARGVDNDAPTGFIRTDL